MDAAVEDGKLEDGVGVLATEARRLREFGFTAAEMDRAKKWMAAFYERAYNERDKTESGSFAQEYVDQLPRRTNRAPASPTSTGSSSSCCRASR